MVNKNLISVKKHEDRELAAKTCFETTPVEIETPQTMILLMESQEITVLLKALSSLDMFAGKHEQNSRLLYQEGILKLLIPLLDHSNLYVKRFSTKLLSELCFIQSVVDTLLEDYDKLLLNMMKMLHEDNDFFVKEFSASVIAELTKTRTGYEQILQTGMIHIIIPLLSMSDPDIQYNCLKILYNLVNEPNEKTVLTDDTSFTIKPFINLLMSEFVAIQNITLDILYLLTEQTKLNPIPKQFQNAGGVMKLLEIIKNYHWKDIHGKSLDILGNIYNDPNIAQNFLKDGVIQLFSYIDIAADPQLIKGAIEVLTKIAETPLGRKVISDSGYITRLEGMLAERNAGVCSAVCHSVANLSQDPLALRQLMTLPTVQDLLKIVVDGEKPWPTISLALNALYEILKRNSEACTFIGDKFEMGFIEKILNAYDKTAPLQAAVTAANCVTTLAGYSDVREKIVNQDLISSLLHCFKDFMEDTSVLKLAACEALCSLLSEPQSRDYLLSLDGLSVIWPSITNHPNNVQFLQSAATFVHLCVTNDKRFTPTLLKLGVLNWLLSQRSLRNDCPAWEMALETIFNHFLPIKFAFTGQLEMTDITENHFYITRNSLTREQLDKNMFPILDTLLSELSCPVNTLYLASFSEVPMAGSKISRVRTTEFRKSSDFKKMTRNSLDSVKGSLYREKILSSDNYLVKYIQSLEEILHQNGFSTEASSRNHYVIDEGTVRGKTRLIGQFVANQMSGMEQNELCTTHMLELHLNEIKVELEDNIIPIGCLRVGLHLERALLFKVLADRVGLPCSLVRGPGLWRRGWVEVCLPHLPPTPRPAFPDYLLRPSHVVDLIQDPGALYQLQSYDADHYCGLV